MTLTSLALLLVAALLCCSLSLSASKSEVVPSSPLSEILGPILYSVKYLNPTSAELHSLYTAEALKDVPVVGLYFSADWCSPCQTFTPSLQSFYERHNDAAKPTKKQLKASQASGVPPPKAFEIVFVSRCRSFDASAQYFSKMPWLALPFASEEDYEDLGLGASGGGAALNIAEELSKYYNVKSIPTLILLDGATGKVITKEGRAKLSADKAGVGFPWRGGGSNLVAAIFPRPIRALLGATVGRVLGLGFGIVKFAWRGVKRIVGM